MEKVFIGLGSNVGDKLFYINSAIEDLKEFIKSLKIAPIYISKAVGYEKQEDFLNTVISGYTEFPPYELFIKIKEVEKQVGRIKRFRWGPREIDIDILFYGNLVMEEKDLVIPHPRLHERDFVLKPLSDLEPNFIHPVLKKTVKELLENIEERSIIGKL